MKPAAPYGVIIGIEYICLHLFGLTGLADALFQLAVTWDTMLRLAWACLKTPQACHKSSGKCCNVVVHVAALLR